MDTEPFDEAALLLPTSSPDAAAASTSPRRRLKRLKKASKAITTSPPPNPSPPSPPPADAETSTTDPSPPSDPLPPPPPPPADADAPAAYDDDGLDPLFPEPGGSSEWETQPMPMEEEEEEEVIAGGGLIEELRREKSAKKRLNWDEGGEAAAPAGEKEAKGTRSKRKKKEAASEVVGVGQQTKESAREKKRFEKERKVQLDSIHAESQRLLRESRSASFKPTVQMVHKPISSVLEKIRLRKLEILRKSSIPLEDDHASTEPASDSAGHPDVPGDQEVGADDKDLSMDDVVDDVGTNGRGLDHGECSAEDGDALNGDSDLNKHDDKAQDEDIYDSSQDNQENNTQSNDSPKDAREETSLALSSSPTKSADDMSSEEDNDKENIDPSTLHTNESTDPRPQRALGRDSCPDDALLRNFVDDEAEEEDDSDNDIIRFKDNEEDNESDENEVFNDLIATGYEEGEVDHKKRNELHQKWLQQQDAAETDNVLQRLKFGQQEQKESIVQDEDDSEDYEDESENEMSYDLAPRNVVRQNSEKAKQMIAQMFTDDHDPYVQSDEEEIEELLVRQRLSNREENTSFISPLEDENSKEVFGLIKKLNIAPQPKRRVKHATSNLEILMVGGNSSSSSKSSFLGRTTSGTLASSHKSTYRTYIFGRDDSNSRSCLSSSESISDTDQALTNQPRKTAKFSSSQTKPVASRTNSEGDTSSGASLFEILRRSSATFDKQIECKNQQSSHMVTESQAAYQFSAFKLARRFSRVGARD